MPNKEELIALYRFKTELHAHALPISRCSEFVPEALAKVYGKVGVDTLVLTNHFTPSQVDESSKEELTEAYWNCYEDVAQAAEKEGFRAIFAMEIRFRQNSNDYLLYGITKEDLPFLYDAVKDGMDIDEFYRAFHSDRVLIFQAHPYRNGCEPAKSESIDGIEVFNMHPGQNARPSVATAFAKEHNLLICGGSDFHCLGWEAGCLLRTKERMETPANVVQALQNKAREQDLEKILGKNVSNPISLDRREQVGRLMSKLQAI